jgi:hypothetical protein
MSGDVPSGGASQSPWETSSGPESSSQTATETRLGGEYTASSAAGSPSSYVDYDRVIDLGRGSGVVGYVGKISATAWMRRIFVYLRDPGEALVIRHADNEIDVALTLPDLTYYTDETDLLSVDEESVYQYHVPSEEACLILGEAFFHASLGSFPVVVRRSYIPDIQRCQHPDFPSTLSDRELLSLLNMIWAIASRWIQTSNLDTNVAIDDHLTYYARARALGLDHRLLYDHPDIYRLQGLGLLSFYLLINGSIQR